MRRGDPLGALRLLRRIETQAARLTLAEELDRERLAADRKRHSDTARALEARDAPQAAYADWLPAAQAESEQAATALRAAAIGVIRARQAAATAALAERAVAEAAARLADAARRQHLAKEQARLDDVAPQPASATRPLA
jgi:hypothetical protein